MEQQVESELFDKLITLTRAENFGEICSEIGKFVEAVTINECAEATGKRATSTKEAIDNLAKSVIISPVLATKLHLVRALRNARIHELTDQVANTDQTYRATKSDARLAVQVLNEFLSWLYEERIAMKWKEALSRFQACEKAFAATGSCDVSLAYWILRDALELKLRSLGIKTRGDLTYGIEVLLERGIDVRSEAWKRLATLRVYDAHGTQEQHQVLQRERTVNMLPELQQVLSKLNPLRSANRGNVECPQAPSEILEALAD
jgi:hypothetical protein